jgi:hypothetical protein
MMCKHRRWLTIPIVSGLVALSGVGLRGGRADDAKRLTADDVVKLWEPKLDGVEDLHLLGSSPKESPGVAAYTFRVVGSSLRP